MRDDLTRRPRVFEPFVKRPLIRPLISPVYKNLTARERSRMRHLESEINGLRRARRWMQKDLKYLENKLDPRAPRKWWEWLSGLAMAMAKSRDQTYNPIMDNIAEHRMWEQDRKALNDLTHTLKANRDREGEAQRGIHNLMQTASSRLAKSRAGSALRAGTSSPNVLDHKIRPGDRVWYLNSSYKFKGRRAFTREVRRLNPGINFRKLTPGQTIKVPSFTRRPRLEAPYARWTKDRSPSFAERRLSESLRSWLPHGWSESRTPKWLRDYRQKNRSVRLANRTYVRPTIKDFRAADRALRQHFAERRMRDLRSHHLKEARNPLRHMWRSGLGGHGH